MLLSVARADDFDYLGGFDFTEPAGPDLSAPETAGPPESCKSCHSKFKPPAKGG